MQIFFEMICAGGGGKDAAQAQGLRPFAMWLSAHVRAGVSGGGGTPRRLKACGLSLCGCRHIFLRKNQGLEICKQLSGPAFSGGLRGL